MLGQAGYIFLGLLGVSVTNGIFGSFSFYINAAICGLLFFTMVMRERPGITIPFFIGFIIGLDLTGSAHAGIVTLFGACTLALAHYAPRILRFTTPMVQGIVGLLAVIILYPLFNFGFTHFFHRLLLLIPLYFILSIGIAIFYRDSQEPARTNLF